jgi:NDP-sugar pyrophosphorylase family protein
MSRKVVILAGGKGTRIRPFSFVIPKPLLPVGQHPIILHLINKFKSFGIKDFIISTGYQAELIRAYFGDGSSIGVNIKYSHEDKPLGTAGPLHLMKKEISDEEYVFLINGDIYTEVDFSKMISFAEKTEQDIIVGYVEKTKHSSFGILQINDDRISQIIEKPVHRYKVSAGIYVLRGRAIKKIPIDTFFTMPDLINLYLAAGIIVPAYQINEFWIGIENAENLDEALKRVEGNESKD